MDGALPPESAKGSTGLALEVAGLCVQLRGGAPVLDGVGFGVPQGRTLALVGESGSGKSITALSVMGLLGPSLRATAGSVRVAGREMLGASEAGWRAARGRAMAMIFQDPVSALDPVLSIGHQVMEAVRVHGGGRMAGRAAARAEALALLDRVRLPDPLARFGAYPHQLSGGMCQRVMIAMALAGRPRLLIADEPTTALDVTVQAQILELLMRIQAEEGMAMLLITHDLGLVAAYAERVAVLYAGRIVEVGDTAALFRQPLHPYTESLLRAAPRLLPAQAAGGRRRFVEIPGQVPSPGAWPPGCGFAPRCARAEPVCTMAPPPLVGGAHRHACVLQAAA